MQKCASGSGGKSHGKASLAAVREAKAKEFYSLAGAHGKHGGVREIVTSVWASKEDLTLSEEKEWEGLGASLSGIKVTQSIEMGSARKVPSVSASAVEA